MPKLTVTVITRDEAANILAALDSVSDADFERARVAMAAQTSPQPAPGASAKPNAVKTVAAKAAPAKAATTASVKPAPVKGVAPAKAAMAQAAPAKKLTPIAASAVD